MAFALAMLWAGGGGGGGGGAMGASALKDDEQVVLYPAWATPVRGGWEVQVHGLIYEPERRRLLGAAVQRLVRLADVELTSAEKATLAERTHYFMVDDERGKRLAVRVGGELFRLGKSGANGHFTGHWRWLTNQPALAAIREGTRSGPLLLDLPLVDGRARTVPVEVHLIEETGWSVISDIDDTIKVSQVRDREALLRNTFCRPFRPVPGMAEVYGEWARRGARFHYVTASPWQLYGPLSEFVASNGFPRGTFHMKQFRWKDSSAVNLLTSPERYKLEMIGPLLRAFPQRRFLLVGDSGEQDPEIYGELARKYPAQIQGIFIRDVTGEGASAARYEAAFARVPGERWQVFREPSEIRPVPW